MQLCNLNHKELIEQVDLRINIQNKWIKTLILLENQLNKIINIILLFIYQIPNASNVITLYLDSSPVTFWSSHSIIKPLSIPFYLGITAYFIFF